MLPRLRPARTNISGDAVLAVGRGDGDDIRIMIRAGGHDLLRLDDLELRQLVAQLRGLLEIQARGCGLHAPAEILADLIVAPFQHLDRGAHIASVVLLGDQTHARRGTSLDLVLQAGPRAVREIGVVAIADAK